MSEPFDRHRALPEGAPAAIEARGFWTPFPEVPSGKICGATTREDGLATRVARSDEPFGLTGHPESHRRGTLETGAGICPAAAR